MFLICIDDVKIDVSAQKNFIISYADDTNIKITDGTVMNWKLGQIQQYLSLTNGQIKIS